MSEVGRFAQRLDRIDDRFRWARINGQGLEPVGKSPTPLGDLEAIAADRLDWTHDPAKGGKPDDKSVQEGAVAVLAEHLGALDGLVREPSGHSEFLDGQNQPWDVKSPVSPDRPGWLFDPYHHLQVATDEIAGGESVLLDMTRLRSEDSLQLLQVLQDGTTLAQRGHLLLLLDQDLVTASKAA
jgi:hypothetical protein